jgi:divalent metal cation (Fe/Co/Zn/Cd) transporter
MGWPSPRLARDPDDAYPFGYGKAEPLAAAVVSLMLLAAAVGIAIEAISEIRTPHRTPAPWTLVVLVAVMATHMEPFVDEVKGEQGVLV